MCYIYPKLMKQFKQHKKVLSVFVEQCWLQNDQVFKKKDKTKEEKFFEKLL